MLREMFENLKSKLAKMPMVMVVLPFAVGIFVADGVELSAWLLLLGSVVALVGVAWLKEGWRNFAIVTSLAMVGALLHTISCHERVEYNRAVDMVLEVDR